MKRTFIFLPIAIVSFALAQDAITLRRTFTDDQIEKFKVKGEHLIKVESDGEEFETSLSLTNNRIFTFNKVDKDGNASIRVEDVDYEGTESAEGETTKIDNPEFYEETFTAKVNPFMELTEIVVKEAMPSEDESADEVDPISDVLESGNLSKYYLTLPSKGVKPGDGWTIPLKNEKIFKPNQSMKGKFRGREKWEDQDVIVLEFTAAVEINVNLDEYDNGKPAFPDVSGAKLTGQIDDKATVYLNPKDYSILFCTDKLAMTVEFKSTDANLSMKIKGEEEMRRTK
ncbi:MAG: hypothetical protein JNK63_11120 [Chthonomonas sp.]|nr:hypothetical protein [Chthonomonas sp.]